MVWGRVTPAKLEKQELEVRRRLAAAAKQPEGKGKTGKDKGGKTGQGGRGAPNHGLNTL